MANFRSYTGYGTAEDEPSNYERNQLPRVPPLPGDYDIEGPFNGPQPEPQPAPPLPGNYDTEGPFPGPQPPPRRVPPLPGSYDRRGPFPGPVQRPNQSGIASSLGAPVGQYGARPAYRGASEMGSFGRMRAAGQSAGWGGSGMGSASSAAAGPSMGAASGWGRQQRSNARTQAAFGGQQQDSAQRGQEQNQQLQGLNNMQRQKPQRF